LAIERATDKRPGNARSPAWHHKKSRCRQNNNATALKPLYRFVDSATVNVN
jgi:hypothetical protein